MGFIIRRRRRLKLAVTATLTSCVLYVVGQALFKILDGHEIYFSDDWIPMRNIKQLDYTGLENKTFGLTIPQTYVMRRNKMIDSCASQPSQPSMYGEDLFRQHLLVDRGRHLVFCGIEKVGLTFWRRFFSILNDANKTSPFDIRAFDAYIPGTVDTMYNKTSPEYNHVMTSSLSVMFSRDPYERLFSAYVDKFISPNINFWINKGTGIIRKYRKFPQFSSLRCGNDVTFPEFVKYVVNHALGQEVVDSHFVTITKHCRPCHIRYDVIGKMATFYNDTMFLIRTVGNTQILDKLQDHFIDAHVRDQFSHSVDLLFFYKKDLVDRHKCVPSFYMAQQRMWRALQMRGLIDLETKYPIKRSESESISKDQLLQVLFNSLKDRVPRVHKRDAMFEAYASVDFVDLHKLRDVFKSDCDLFDYDCSPIGIFNKSLPRKRPDRFFNFE